MARQRSQITITLPPELVKWIDKMVEKRVFANRSHAVEVCVLRYQELLKEEIKS